MKFTIILMSVLAISTACPASEFYDGLVTGLETDPSSIGQCGTKLLLLSQQLAQIYNDVMGILSKQSSAVTSFVNDCQAFDETLKSVSPLCNFPAFFSKLTSFTTASGRNAMFQAYLKNVAVIDSLIPNVINCSKDYNKCGESLGQIITMLTGASLNTNFHLSASPSNSSAMILNFFEGLMGSYMGTISHTALCQGNVLRLLPTLADVENPSNTAIQDAEYSWMFSVEETVLTTCFETDWKHSYSPENVIKFFGVLTDIKAWQLSYFTNTDEMNTLFGQIEKCSTDPSTCGQAVTSIALLVGPWVNYH